jgi:aldehyde dehydrogenase (NAD+)
MQLLEEAELPAGVVNLITGPGGTLGGAILDDARVRGISFTGSNEVGTAIATRAAARLQKTQLEMGGKNPVVVLEDADLELAVDGCVQGAFGSTGQRCTATSRAVVVDSLHDAFVAAVVQRARGLRLGRGDADGVEVGPVVDESQLRTVLEGVVEGTAAGARLECGGVRRRGAGYDRGWFVEPAVLTGVTPDMPIARTELFGPVLCVLRVPHAAAALAVANDVPYGLSASLYTRDVARAFEFIEHIEAGIVHVNSPTVGGEAQLPFGGVKSTGIGGREMGSTATDFFTEIKTVYVDYTGTKRATKSY